MNGNKKDKAPICGALFHYLDKFIYALVVLLVIIFILFPIGKVISKSILLENQVSFKLYEDLVQNNYKLLVNSIQVAILTTLITTFLATCVATVISLAKKKIQRILQICLLLTMISPPFVSALAYINLFGRRGFITHNLLGLSINPYGLWGIVSMESLAFTSLGSLLLIGVIKGIDKKFIQASQDLGANANQTLLNILLPLMRPGILVVALLTFVRALADFGTPIIIGGAFNVLATQAYLYVIGYGDLSMAAAISVLIFIPALFVFFAYRKILGKSQFQSLEVDSENGLSGILNLKSPIGTLMKIVTIFFLIVMLLQYSSIIMGAFIKHTHGVISFTLEHFREMTQYKADSLVRSVVYSLIAGIGGSILGFLVAYYLEIRQLKGMKYIDFIATMPYILPGTFLGIGYILAFNQAPLALTGTSLIVILNVIFKQLPMSTKINSAVLSQINPQLEEGAKDLGANNIFVLKDIILPLSKNAFAISFINNFTATMTTIGSIIFLIYPGKKLATVEMFDAIQSGDYGVGSAIATTIILITIVVNVSFLAITKEKNNVFRNKKF